MTSMKLIPRDQVDQSRTWDMTLIYATNEDFVAAIEKLEADLPVFKTSYEGKLVDAKTIHQALLAYEDLALVFSKLYHYAELPLTVDRFNPQVLENASRFAKTRSIYAQATSFLESDLRQASQEVLDQVVADYRPDLKHFVEKIIRSKAHALDKAAEEVLSALNALPGFENLYEVTKHEDMTFDSFQALDQTFENSFVLYENLYEMDERKEVRRAGAESFYKTLNAYKNTVANEYISQIKKEKQIASLRGYESVIDYLLDQQDGDRELYDRQIKTLMTDLAPHIRRYIKLLAKVHGIEDMQFADCKINLDPDYEVDMSIEESRDYLKKALGILGQDYLDMIDQSYDQRWTDFPQNIGKSTGGFCATVPKGASYILLSWTGKMNEVFVLAHELGHAYHFQRVGQDQSMLNFDSSLYFVEAPSTCNEVIVSNYLLSQSQDPRFKRWVISNMISRTYFHNMVTHYLEAVYQDRIYKMLDQNETLNAEVLSKVTREVMEEFFGDSLVVNPGAELTWMRQPHYYMGLYPYTYSAGLTIGTAVANKMQEDPSLAQNWKDTIALGDRLSAKELAARAGVDVSTDQPLQEALAYVGHLVDQLESLSQELGQA